VKKRLSEETPENIKAATEQSFNRSTTIPLLSLFLHRSLSIIRRSTRHSRHPIQCALQVDALRRAFRVRSCRVLYLRRGSYYMKQGALTTSKRRCKLVSRLTDLLAKGIL
jgi:hypothetical protein